MNDNEKFKYLGLQKNSTGYLSGTNQIIIQTKKKIGYITSKAWSYIRPDNGKFPISVNELKMNLKK